MKKTKKIILAVIVAIISLISVFSCVKGKYTPEPILTPVSVLKPANSANDNVISPTGTYDYLYFNTSYNFYNWTYFVNGFSFDIYVPSGTFPFWEGIDKYFYPLYIDNVTGDSIMLSKSVYLNDSRLPTSNLELLNINTFASIEVAIDNINGSPYWRLNYNPFEISLNNGSTTFNFMGTDYPVGNKNNLFTNIISPVPFLFEGTNTQDMESSGINTTTIEDFYINTTLTNESIKTQLDNGIGDTSGTSFNISVPFMDNTNTEYYSNYKVNIINDSANAFIQLLNASDNSLVEYWYIYDSIDTDEDIYWYGLNPDIIELNGRVFSSLPLENSINISYDGTLETNLNFLFSDTNDFAIKEITPPTYEQGYEDGFYDGSLAGYQEGKTDGINEGVQQVINDPNEYNLFTYQEWLAQYDRGLAEGNSQGYNQGYLDGLDDGASSNINYQYVESVLILIGNFLNIEILPNIKLSYALGIVIILSIISIIKMVVK